MLRCNPRMLPNFLIVGAQKSGTSALWSYLEPHPQVYMSPEKELRFFNRNFHLGSNWYEEQFRGHAGEKLVGEATPNYLYVPECAERIAATLPDVKLIFLFREPVARALSNYWHNVWLGREYLSFESAIRREPERMKLAERYRTPYWSWTYSYLDKGRYARQILPYLERFDRSQMLFLLFEDVVGRPEASIERVYSFLGLDSRPLRILTDEQKNTTWVQRSLAAQRAVNAVAYFVLIQSYEWLGWRKGYWGRTNFVAKAVHLAQLKLNTVRGRYPALFEETRARLEREFDEDNRTLAHMIGRDLSGWSSASPQGLELHPLEASQRQITEREWRVRGRSQSDGGSP